MKKFLLTGFEPFNGHPDNPSQMLVQHLSKKFKFHHVILPVAYERALVILNQQIKKDHYDFVLMLGLAADREKVCLERVGLNLMDSRIADADGVWKLGEKIDEQGESAIFSELPLREWIQNSEMIISNSAGTYVCNFIYYKTLQGSHAKKSLFVHVPWIQDSAHEEKIKQDLSQLISKISEAL